jgi:hypothetical protein
MTGSSPSSEPGAWVWSTTKKADGEENHRDHRHVGAAASNFGTYSDLNLVTDNGKAARAAWTFNGGFERLQNGRWTFTGSLVTSQGTTPRTFTFDPEIGINM